MGEDQTTFEIFQRVGQTLIHIDNIVKEKNLLTDVGRTIISLNKAYDFKKIYIDEGGIGVGVFDYLLEGRDSQIEAENILTEHLKRIKAYLKPGTYYHSRHGIDTEDELVASIIIPVNNRPEFIGTAIESVQVQTIQQIEVIVVVNGGQDDPTVNEVQRYMPGGNKYDAGKPEVQLLIHDINNIGLCLNLGAKAARGKYYVQLDSDDRLKPDAVEKI